jgi:hypothetical protein
LNAGKWFSDIHHVETSQGAKCLFNETAFEKTFGTDWLTDMFSADKETTLGFILNSRWSAEASVY